jgi:hypothetical protein
LEYDDKSKKSKEKSFPGFKAIKKPWSSSEKWRDMGKAG